MTGHYGYAQLNGRHFDYFPWPVALFAVPAVAVLDGAHAVGIGPGTLSLIDRDKMAYIHLVSASLVGAGVATVIGALVFELLGGELRRRRRLAFGFGLAFALATSTWSTASRALWQHGPSMLFVSLALLMAARMQRSPSAPGAGRRSAALGAALAAAYTVRPTNAVCLALFTGWVLVTRRRVLAPFLGGVAAVLVPFVAVNVASFDRLLPPYYGGGRVGLVPGGEALLANLVSPNRGLLLFTPIALLAVVGFVLKARRRQLDGLDLVVAGSAGAHWIVVSAFPHWWAGHAYGPRFMTDALPALAFLAVPAVAEVVEVGGRATRSAGFQVVAAGLVLLLAWSVFVNAQGAYLRASACWNVQPEEVDSHPGRVWAWSDPQFLSGIDYVLHKRPLTDALLHPCPQPEPTAAGGP